MLILHCPPCSCLRTYTTECDSAHRSMQVLSSSEGNILDDATAVATITEAKATANDIAEKQALAAGTERDIEAARVECALPPCCALPKPLTAILLIVYLGYNSFACSAARKCSTAAVDMTTIDFQSAFVQVQTLWHIHVYSVFLHI